MDLNEKKILISTSVGHYLAHFFVLVFPALVIPISRDLSISPDQVISMSFGMYLCYGFLALPWGYLSDRFQPHYMMGAGLIMAGLGFAAAGRAGSINRLPLYFSMVGAGCSAYHPSGLALISKGIRRRGRALGINGLFGNLGMASAPMAAGILCYLWGWRSTLLVLGAVAAVLGCLIILLPFSVDKNRDLQKGTSVEGQQAVLLFVLLCGVMFFSGLLYRGYTVILPTFLEGKLSLMITDLKGLAGSIFHISSDSENVNTMIATIITTGVYLIGMVGQLLGGRVADRFDLRKAYLAFFLFAFPFLIFMGYFKGIFLVMAAGLFIFFSLGMQPIENSLVAMLTPPKWRGIVYGLKFTVVFGAGSLSVQMVSFAHGRFGLDSIVPLLAVFLAMIIIMIGVLLFCSRGATVRHERGQ